MISHMKNLQTSVGKLLLSAAMTLSCAVAMAQNKVTGTVIDDKGDPIIGATVRVNGSKEGTVTDLDGHFSLSAAQDTKLSISYVGYVTREVDVKGTTPVKVVLSESAKSLNDIIVIGYGIQKKADLSSAIAVLDAKEITKTPGGLSAGLQSQVPGVQVTNGRIHIRGVGSINNTDPLYVVDGMIGGAVPDENDIASIQVLKDAASCAIYGARGANGVIVLTTKRGKAGKTTVDYNGYLGWKTFTNEIDLLNGRQLAELINEEMYNINPQRTDYMKGLSDPEAIGEGYNMFKAITRTGSYQKHNVSVSGGSENANFRVTGIYGNDKSLYVKEGSENFTMNVVSDFKKGIFGFGETVTIGRNLNHNTDMLKLISIKWSTACPIYDPQAPTGYAGASLGTDMENPRATADNTWHRNETNTMTGNAWLTVEPIKGLVYKFNFGADLYRFNSRSYVADYYVGDYQKNTPDTYSMGNNRSNRFLYEHTLTYDKAFGDHRLNFMAGITSEETKGYGFNASARAMPGREVLILGATQKADSKEVGSSELHNSMYSYLARAMYSYAGKYMLTANFRRDGSSNFSKANRYGNFPSFSAAWRVSQEKFMKSLTWLDDLKLRASWGKLGNANISPYQYQSTVSFNAVRYYFNDVEHTGALPMTPSNPDVKWEASTSTDIGFDLTMLKNRLSLTADYYRNKTQDMLVNVPIARAAGYIDAFPTMNAGSIENKGFELVATWRDHIGSNFDYSVSANLSTVSNKVLGLGANNEIFAANNVTCTRVGNSIGQFWGYKTAGLFRSDTEAASYVNDKGERLQPAAKAGDIRFIDLNGDGVINAGDQTFIGNPIPSFSYGFSVEAQYRAAIGTFDFSMVWNGSQGNDIYNNTRYYGEGMYHNYACFSSTLNRFRAEELTFVNPVSGKTTVYPKNTETDMPRAAYGDPNQNMRQSDRYVENGSYLRLKTIVLGYTMPKDWCRRVYMENMRFYVGAKNLFTFTGYTGYDPEVGDQDSSGTNLTRGVDGLTSWDLTFPNNKEFYIGLQLTF
ncbi:TonB-linked outer membrane protein, SusC/RagA family [Segatella buccae D17]|nr:TonB-linked outer membrane protein, SusC/RagA family [Segatella buccae D17]